MRDAVSAMRIAEAYFLSGLVVGDVFVEDGVYLEDSGIRTVARREPEGFEEGRCLFCRASLANNGEARAHALWCYREAYGYLPSLEPARARRGARSRRASSGWRRLVCGTGAPDARPSRCIFCSGMVATGQVAVVNNVHRLIAHEDCWLEREGDE